MRQIADTFYENAEIQPDKRAIWCDGITLTYGELRNKVSQYSNLFIDQGVKYGDHIGFPMNNSIESVIVMLTAANLGLTLVPINPTIGMDGIKAAFEIGKVKHIIARKNFLLKLDEEQAVKIEGKYFCMDEIVEGYVSLSEASSYSVNRPITLEVTGEEPFILTLTSGSTGNPKPIVLTQNNKLKRSFEHIELYNITKEDNVLAATPLYHSLAERLVLIPLLIGATSILLPRFTPLLWMNCVKEEDVTFTIAVSAQLAQINNTINDEVDCMKQLHSMRCIVSSSSLLDYDVKKQLIEKLNCEFHEMYGASEVSTVTSILFNSDKGYEKSVGKAIACADIRILNEQNEVLGDDQIGEIAVKTDLICNGYYGMQTVFQSSLADGYFKTGDMGYLDSDGYLYFTGRKKEIIITGGINVYPNDIESCVKTLPGIEQCAAFSIPDKRLGEIVGLAIVLSSGHMLTERQIQKHCARNLADYQQPHKIYFLDRLPMNSMNKLMRNKIIDEIK